jgi:hypothetical protein
MIAVFSCKLLHDLIRRNLAQPIDIDGIDSDCQSYVSQHDVWSYSGCVECKSSPSVQVIFCVTATTMMVPFLRGKTLLRDFNTQSGFSSGFSGFWVVFRWFLDGFCKNHFRQNNE